MQARTGGSPWYRSAARVVVGALTLAVGGCAAPEAFVNRIDEGHKEVDRSLGELVDNVDRVFGEPRVEDRQRIARARLSVKAEGRENHSPSYTVPLQLRLPLPALERRANIFLQLDSVADATGDLDQAGRSIDDSKSLSATILSRYGGQIETGAHGELYWKDGPQTGLRPFVRWEGGEDPVRLHLEQQVYYLTDRHFGVRSIAELDRSLGESSFLRLLATVEANQEIADADVVNALIYRRSAFGGAVVLSVEVGAAYNPYDGDTETRERGPAADPDEAYLLVRVIRRFLRPWLEYEITPVAHHPWRHGDRTEYGISFLVRLTAESHLSGK